MAVGHSAPAAAELCRSAPGGNHVTDPDIGLSGPVPGFRSGRSGLVGRNPCERDLLALRPSIRWAVLHGPWSHDRRRGQHRGQNLARRHQAPARLRRWRTQVRVPTRRHGYARSWPSGLRGYRCPTRYGVPPWRYAVCLRRSGTQHHDIEMKTARTVGCLTRGCSSAHAPQLNRPVVRLRRSQS